MYSINDEMLTCVNIIKDLEVLFDYIKFLKCPIRIVNNAYNSVGFIKIYCKDFHNRNDIKLLYYSYCLF